MPIGPVGGKEGAEGPEKEVQAVAAVVQSGGEAVLQVPGGGVERGIEGLPVPRQEVAVLNRDLEGDIDGVVAALGFEGEAQLPRWQCRCYYAITGLRGMSSRPPAGGGRPG